MRMESSMAIGSTPARSTTSRRNSETKNAASMLRMHGCDMHTSITGVGGAAKDLISAW